MTQRTNRIWLPSYCQPGVLLPRIQNTRTLFAEPPYLFSEFVGKAMSLLKSDLVAKMGFKFDPAQALPCKWKCSDESLFGVDLTLYAQTGDYPFDKGKIGGFFNESSLGASIHHGAINLDFGGGHVGFLRDETGAGSFGHIFRPQQRCTSTDCGYLMSVLSRFVSEYDDAASNIFIFCPIGEERMLVRIPNEFIQPCWSSRVVKLLIDVDELTAGEVGYEPDKPYTHTAIGSSLFYLSDRFIDRLSPEALRTYRSAEPTAIGRDLTAEYFNIFDTQAPLGDDGLPRDRLLPYMKYVVSARHAPPPLKAAIINTNIEHNNLTDTVRGETFRAYGFASFTGVFIDLYDEVSRSYASLFQPLAASFKPRGKTREVHLAPDELRDHLDPLPVDPPKVRLERALTLADKPRLLDQFTFSP